MRFRGLKANIALPLLLAIGVVMVVYGVIRSDSSSIIFGIVDMALSVFLFISTHRNKGEETDV